MVLPRDMGIPTFHATKLKVKSDSIAGGNRAFVPFRSPEEHFFTAAALFPAFLKRTLWRGLHRFILQLKTAKSNHLQSYLKDFLPASNLGLFSLK